MVGGEVCNMEQAAVKPTVDTFHYLYNTHYQEMFYIANNIIKDRHMAEDIIQETFIKAYKHREEIVDCNKIKFWLRTVVTRTAIDVLRKEKRVQLSSIEDVHISLLNPLYSYSLEEEVANNLYYKNIKKNIANLNPLLRDVINLKVIYDYRDEDIAKKLNISLSAVKSRIHRARKQLKTNSQKNVSPVNDVSFMYHDVQQSPLAACQKLQVVF